MIQFLEAGLVATARQSAAIAAVTLIAVGLSWQEIIVPGGWATCSEPLDICHFVSLFLGWAYLVTAVGVALTKDRSVAVTAKRIREAARLTGPGHGPIALAVQLVLCTILFALFAFYAPPKLLIEIVQFLGIACAGSAVWTGIISIVRTPLSGRFDPAYLRWRFAPRNFVKMSYAVLRCPHFIGPPHEWPFRAKTCL